MPKCHISSMEFEILDEFRMLEKFRYQRENNRETTKTVTFHFLHFLMFKKNPYFVFCEIFDEKGNSEKLNPVLLISVYSMRKPHIFSRIANVFIFILKKSQKRVSWAFLDCFPIDTGTFQAYGIHPGSRIPSSIFGILAWNDGPLNGRKMFKNIV